jgi:hypothetical protein
MPIFGGLEGTGRNVSMILEFIRATERYWASSTPLERSQCKIQDGSGESLGTFRQSSHGSGSDSANIAGILG